MQSGEAQAVANAARELNEVHGAVVVKDPAWTSGGKTAMLVLPSPDAGSSDAGSLTVSSISAMAKSPSTAMTKLIPSISSTAPNVSRVRPVRTSIPTTDTRSPSAA